MHFFALGWRYVLWCYAEMKKREDGSNVSERPGIRQVDCSRLVAWFSYDLFSQRCACFAFNYAVQRHILTFLFGTWRQELLPSASLVYNRRHSGQEVAVLVQDLYNLSHVT